MARFHNTDGTLITLGVVGALAAGSLLSKQGSAGRYESAERVASAYLREQVDPEILNLINLATYHLFWGSVEDEDWPGWTSAVEQIGEALDDLPDTVYVESWSESVISPQEAEEKADYEVVVEVDTKRTLLGKELAPYVH